MGVPFSKATFLNTCYLVSTLEASICCTHFSPSTFTHPSSIYFFHFCFFFLTFPFFVGKDYIFHFLSIFEQCGETLESLLILIMRCALNTPLVFHRASSESRSAFPLSYFILSVLYVFCVINMRVRPEKH